MSAQIDETLEKLKNGLTELFESDKYRKFLDAASKFHTYSVNNQILIAMQNSNATQVAGYTTWKSMNRQVMKGEKGISIIAPNNKKEVQEMEAMGPDGEPILDFQGKPIMEKREIVHPAFRVAKVFDISQTQGEPLPELVTELKDPVKGFDEYMDAIMGITPVPVRFDNIDSGAKGYFSSKKQEIVLQRGMPEEQTIKTLIHECAHARLGHGSSYDNKDRNTREVEAESIAYCCCRAIGIDTSDYSFGYIAGWSSGKDQKELKQSLQTIRNHANQMITELENNLAVTMKIQQKSQKIAPDIKQNAPKISF